MKAVIRDGSYNGNGNGNRNGNATAMATQSRRPFYAMLARNGNGNSRQ
jgi:hypothetical protein